MKTTGVSVAEHAVPHQAFSHSLHLVIRRGSRVRIYSISHKRHRALRSRSMDSNPEQRCKTLSDRFQPSYRPLSLARAVPLAKKSTSFRFTIWAKSMAIRSRSCRACESASICLWPSVVMVAALLRSCVKSRTSNTSTPTVTRSSANVNAAMADRAVAAGVSPARYQNSSRHGCLYRLRSADQHRLQFLSNAANISTEPLAFAAVERLPAK